jgi:hypothetical protein
MTARILDVTPAEYHALPGLSSSIASTLISRSPLHAWTEHPAYGAKERGYTKATDRGSVVHSMVLGKGSPFASLPFDDYRTNAAKESRDKTRAAGLIPMLWHEHDDALRLAQTIKERLAARGIALDGRSELAVEWHEQSGNGSVMCRGMMDHVWLDRGRILDLKIVQIAEPSYVERSAERFGYAIQAAAYSRALAAVRPVLAGRVEFIFAFCETEEPYAINLSKPDGVFRELGERRWMHAVNTWGQCLWANDWPGYGDGINFINPPAWLLAREGY